MRLLILLFILLFVPSSAAAEFAVFQTSAMPPILLITQSPLEAKQFTRREPAFAAELAKHKSTKLLHYDKALAALLEKVNTEGNTNITWTSDQDTWGQEENWDFPCQVDEKLYDDCDGFALWKLRRLIDLGLPSTPLLFTLTYTEGQKFHAVLVVATDAGDFVLDNRMKKVMRSQDLIAFGYNFDSRVAAGDQFDGLWVQFKPIYHISSQPTGLAVPQRPKNRLCLPR
jgi:predicted transglutaminase-like cysteine proteinase